MAPAPWLLRFAGGSALGALLAPHAAAECARAAPLPASFDPEALERAAKALREIQQSPQASRVLDLAKKQEETKQQEEKTKEAQNAAAAAQYNVEREKVHFEELRKTQQQSAQQKAQLAQYEDELARKRMQAEHEANRARNAEMVKMQEESNERQEVTRRSVEETIQAARRETNRQQAEMERENLRIKTLAEAEGRSKEARDNEDVQRRQMQARVEAETSKMVKVVNTTLSGLGSAGSALLADRAKLTALVGSVTVLAAGVYSAREGSRMGFRMLERYLGQPALLRESSRSVLPWKRPPPPPPPPPPPGAAGGGAGAAGPGAGGVLGDVVLERGLEERLRQLAGAAANTRRRKAPFRNMLFYGPPGTGKTMAAKRLARYAGLDYALLTGGDVAPLGAAAVPRLHEVFDWAKRSPNGLLLFVDEAEAFLAKRGTSAAETARAALNATLARTGDQSNDFMLVLATNRPFDLDPAVVDRVDDAMEFALPGPQERRRLVRLYFDKYILGKDHNPDKAGAAQAAPTIPVVDVDDELLDRVAERTEGFSGRELAKLWAAIQAAVYGTEEGRLTAAILNGVLEYKVVEHQMRETMTAAS